MTMMLWTRTTGVAAVLLACACAGKSPEPARPAVNPEPSSPPAASPAPSPPPAASPAPSSDAPAGAGAAGNKSSAKPVGTKLLQDAKDSPKAFKLSKDDGSGHGLGKVSMTVDGRSVWPPEGPGCPELARCCTALAGVDDSMALACLLAVGRDPDCPTALRTSVAIAGESSVALPAACPR
jgi:hypothetical protein